MKLSIITVNYNDKVGLKKTIESVLCQAYTDYEYIIIDGGSTDGSYDIIKQYEEQISYWVSERDKGIYNAMNKAIDVAQGEYCIFMNAGDTFCSPMTLADVFVIDCSEDIICGNTVTVEKRKFAPEEITFRFMFSNAICHQSAFIKTSLMAKYKYDEKYRIVSDRKFFLQALILDNCSYKNVPVDIVNYDITGYSAENPVLSRLEYDKVLEELFPRRILCDYGRETQGQLYGETMYDRLFIELRRRNYKSLIYTIVVVLMYLISVVKTNAKFIKNFPLFLNDVKK